MPQTGPVLIFGAEYQKVPDIDSEEDSGLGSELTDSSLIPDEMREREPAVKVKNENKEPKIDSSIDVLKNRADMDSVTEMKTEAEIVDSSMVIKIIYLPLLTDEMPKKRRVVNVMKETEEADLSIDSSLITVEMREEERALELKNEAKEAKIRAMVEQRACEEKQEKEIRHKRLMALLTKSQFYSQYMLSQIEKQKKQKQNNMNRRVADAKLSSAICNKENVAAEAGSSQSSSENSSQNSERRNVVLNENAPGEDMASVGAGGNKRRKKIKVDYSITEIVDEEVVKQSAKSSTDEREYIPRQQQPRFFEGGIMRPYQLDGFSWLKVLYESGINGILADEMGLGKTIQCIALLCHLVDNKVSGPFLVCAPLSTLPNWITELQRFAPKIPAVLYHGSEAERIGKRHTMNKKVNVEGTTTRVFPVVITSYEVVVRDAKYLSQTKWTYVIVDEGHKIKNHKTQLAHVLKSFTSSNRLLLTGTPLQNNLAELWSLLNFLMPEIFNSLDVFESWFNIDDMMSDDADARIVQQERESQVISTLQQIMQPFMLRRIKRDIDLQIPPKRELLVYTPMTTLQLKLYEATIKRDFSLWQNLKEGGETKIQSSPNGRARRKCKDKANSNFLLMSEFQEEDSEGNISEENCLRYFEALSKCQNSIDCSNEKNRKAAYNIKLQNIMMQCRKIVNHPFLIEYPLDSEGFCMIDETLLKHCGKLQVLDQLLTELHARGHKVLLFSQMTMLLDVLEDYLSLRPQYSYKRLDGRVKLSERQSDIAAFNDVNSHCFLYLLSTRSGGLGINLTAADTVIIYDSDWNPQQDLQAQDRCHRIGQTRPVLILRLVTSATIDERIVERAATKRKLEKMIICSGANKSHLSNKVLMDPTELLELLQKTDHERIHRTSHGNVFTKEELDQILDRSDFSNTNENKSVTGVFKSIA